MSDEMKNCPACGEPILASAKKCKHCGEWLDKSSPAPGADGELPPDHRKFNWGAFLLTWIWGIGNKTYIALLMLLAGAINLIPIVGPLVTLAFAIWLGIKGNELAWKNGTWRSLDHFEETQRKWAMWGGIVIGICILAGILIGLVGVAGAASGIYD